MDYSIIWPNLTNLILRDQTMAIDDKELDELMPDTELNWTEDARARMLN